LIEGEYTAPAVALGIAIVMLMGLGEQELKPFNPAEFMMGSAYLDRHSNLLVGGLPWSIACIFVGSFSRALSCSDQIHRSARLLKDLGKFDLAFHAIALAVPKH
jgi:hypothetical protein